MNIEDIKIGMKVELLSKHGCCNKYDNIEDWYNHCSNNKNVQQLKQQGYGYVVKIKKDCNMIWVDEAEDGTGWCFTSLDLKIYEEEKEIIKTPKEWLLTPKAIFTVRSEFECITLGDGTAIIINNGNLWSTDLDFCYREDLSYYNRFSEHIKANDIMKIEYNGKIVWERKEVKKLTLKEIEKELGYKVEIVNE